MNNENKSIFENDAANNIIEEEIVLAPPTEWIEEAKAIAQNTQDNEKFPFMLAYDANQNEFLLAMLHTAGAIVVRDDEEYHILSTRMNMAQLALIKRLDCVKRVITDEGTNPFLAEEAEKSAPTQWNMQENGEPLDDGQNGPSLNMGEASLEIAAGLAASEVEKQNANGIAAASAAAAASATGSCCNCPTNVSMKTAAVVSDESYTSGYICCPGAAQWFKFTATRSGQYTICTTGSLDTIGTLYDCSGNLIVEVDDYAPCGKINFRIIRNLTAGCTYYVKVRICGNDTGNYALRVADRVFADYVTINKNIVTLEKGVLYELPLTPNYSYKGYNGAIPIPGLSVSIHPSNATEQKIFWWDDFSGALNCTHGWDANGDRYIHVAATEIGIAKLYAEDWNENGKRDDCMVYVGGAPVVGVTFDRTSKIVSLNDTEQLNAIIAPANALNKGITWTSSNSSVVAVDSNGVVTGLKVGTATIRAKTEEGGYVATCTVTVDKRPKVMIERDEYYSFGNEDYINITFSNGKIWRSIGCDLALPENRSIYPLWYKNDCYDSFTVPEQRYVDNIEQTFTAQELALIYRLDPLGVEYYMKNDACDDMSLAETLFFRDDVYKAIFGEPQSDRFYFTINDSGQVLYGTYVGWNRTDVYSNAETLFGSHVIFDWSNFWQSILTTLFEAIPGVSYVQTGVEIYQALFHTGSFWGLYSNYAKSKVEEYVTAPLNDFVKDKLGEKAHKCIGWANNLISMLKDAAFSAFVIPNLNDITIYNTIEEQNDYRVVFENYDGNLSLQEIIDLCENQ